MGFVVKRPSRMQREFCFQSWAGRTTVFSRVQKNPMRRQKFHGRAAPPRSDIPRSSWGGGGL
jgi:hypothetical protein